MIPQFFRNGDRVRKGRLAAAAAVALTALALILLSGGDPVRKNLAELRDRLEPLRSELEGVEARARTGAAITVTRQPFDAKPIEAAVAALEQESTKALSSKDPMRVAAVMKRMDAQISNARGLLENAGRPRGGAGVIAADAKSLLTRLDKFREDSELRLEPLMMKSPDSRVICEDFLEEISNCQGRARGLISPAGPSVPDETEQGLKVTLGQLIARLEAVRGKLKRFSPPPPPPFNPDGADLVITAAGSLASDLVVPLTAAWSGGKVIPGEDGVFYLTEGGKGNIVVRPCAAETGFQMLAEGRTAVYFADRAPSADELSKIGGGYQESRSVAEVVALDALTFLVHPDSALSTLTMDSPLPLQPAAGAPDSAVRAKAVHFRLPVEGASGVSGEQAALADRNLLSFSLYHEEGPNLRAKRLAVRAAGNVAPLTPSPFTIATEDYPYSFRIVAWTPAQASEAALQLVRFATSGTGQEIVGKQGFVDLRLKGSQEQVHPRILAALGSAVGSDRITSAFRVSTNFRFAVGKADLDLKALADLERLPRFVFDKYPAYKVVILGFTDSDGGPGINIPLSRERAAVVEARLKPSKMDVQSNGLGDEFPVDTNSSEAGKAKNRRAEVWLVRAE